MMVERILGTITRIEGGRAFVTFEKKGGVVERTIPLSTLRSAGAVDVQPGDRVALRSTGLPGLHKVEYLGPAEIEIDEERLSSIDEGYKKMLKRSAGK